VWCDLLGYRLHRGRGREEVREKQGQLQPSNAGQDHESQAFACIRRPGFPLGLRQHKYKVLIFLLPPNTYSPTGPGPSDNYLEFRT